LARQLVFSPGALACSTKAWTRSAPHCSNQHCDRSLRAVHRPGQPGHGQAQQQKPHRVAVGHPDERHLRSLGFRHQADDARLGRHHAPSLHPGARQSAGPEGSLRSYIRPSA